MSEFETTIDVNLDFTNSEADAINRVTGYGCYDDADMREAIHIMIDELSKLKGIDVSDIPYREDDSYADI